MKNAEMVKAFRMIAEGFSTLANAFEVEEVVTPIVEPVKEVKETIKETVKEEPQPQIQEEAKKSEKVVETTEEVKEESLTYTYEDLEGMSYNDLKSLAKELGVKAIGTKKVIIDSILAHIGAESNIVEEPKATDVEIEEIETSSEEDIDVQEVDEDEDMEVEVEHTTLYDQVVSDLEGYTDEELADVLSDVGISPKGRRQALLAKIVQAIEDGVIEWEEEDATEEPETEVEEEVEEPQEHETNARIKARKDEEKAILLAYDKGELSHKEIIKYLKDFNNGRYVSQGEEGDIQEYIAIQCDLIDDEGIKHELADPYYVGDYAYCCGQELNEVDEDLYCEICGTTYEA